MFVSRVLVSAEKVNLAGGWKVFWDKVQGQLGGITTLLTVIGALLVVMALVMWLMERRRSGSAGMGQGAQKVMWAGIVGAVLAAPGFILPIMLGIIDLVINSIMSVMSIGGGTV